MRFYSSVILNSTETIKPLVVLCWQFYSSVILNSTETQVVFTDSQAEFYSSVILLSKLLGNYNERQYY